jgi:hypothetical protein
MKARIHVTPFIPPLADVTDLLWVSAEVTVKLVTEL